MERKRCDWIDYAKGIAAILVVLGHISVPIPKYISTAIYGSHMPMFFLVSGYVMKDKGESVGKFVKKKFLGLVIPLYIYSTIIWLIHYLYFGLYLKTLSMDIIKNELIGFVYQMKNGGQYKSMLWFLPCMFIASIIVFLFIRKVKTLKIHIICMLILGVAGSVVSYYANSTGIINSFPWCLDYVLLAATFIYLGYIIKNFAKMKKYTVVIYGVVFALTCMANYQMFDKIICLFQHVGNLGITWVQSISGALLLLNIAYLLKDIKIPILKYIGRNSLFFYPMQFVVFPIVNIFYYQMLGISVDRAQNEYKLLAKALLYLLITLALIYVINKIKDRLKKLIVGH